MYFIKLYLIVSKMFFKNTNINKINALYMFSFVNYCDYCILSKYVYFITFNIRNY